MTIHENPDTSLVKRFLQISKAHEGTVTFRGAPLPEGSFPAEALEIVEYGYVLPSEAGRFTDVRSHRTAAAHVAAKSKDRHDYEQRLEDTPAGACWLCFGEGTLFMATDRPPDRPIFEVLGEDPRDLDVYDVEDGNAYTGLIA